MADGIAPYLVENMEPERERSLRADPFHDGRGRYYLSCGTPGKKVTVVAEKLDDLLYASYNCDT